jgi:protein-S-isoprenylcysteine O-methyltransferase Ste14
MNSLVILSLAYALSEFSLMFIKRSKHGTVKTRRDRGSLIFLWSMIALGFTAGFIMSKPANNFWIGFGLPFIIGGLIIRWIAIIQLGNSFTVDVAINRDADLKTDGIYEKVRHPSYSGMLLIITGFSITMCSLYSFLVLVVPVFIAVLYRINVEEKLLTDEFGESYSEYKKETRKLIIGIY